jgi:GxxExxY protein
METQNVEYVATQIVDAAIKVHRSLGPGLLESAYQKCLAIELRKRGLLVECELMCPVTYDGVTIESGYRIDMLIGKSIIIENKTVEKILPIHEAQLLTYLRISGYPIGFLLNWSMRKMSEGIKRKANTKQ